MNWEVLKNYHWWWTDRFKFFYIDNFSLNIPGLKNKKMFDEELRRIIKISIKENFI